MNHLIRAVIVEDELPAREHLIYMLNAHPNVQIVGQAGDVDSALKLCVSELPDLIFLDVSLPRGSGFDLLPNLTGSPSIIFITASDHHAIKAFEVNALDYLLKPVHPERLAQALSRVIAPERGPSPENMIALSDDRSVRFVSLKSITHIEAVDNYTNVHLLNGLPSFIRRPMAGWEKLLPSDQFLRVDRSLIVRLDAVIQLCSETRDNSSLLIAGRVDAIMLGRRAALFLRRAMKNC